MIKFSVLLLVFLVYLQGCVAVQTFPTAARAGDTITLAVGSPEGMNANNTTITFISDADPSNSIDLTTAIRAMPKIWPDKRSTAWIGSPNSLSDLIAPNSGHGPWLQMIALDLPDTLPIGPGVININTSTEVKFPINSANINTTPIGIDILESIGTSNLFKYKPYGASSNNGVVGNLNQLEPNSHIEVIYPIGNSSITYGAIELTVYAPVLSSLNNTVNDEYLNVVFDDQPRNLKSLRQVSWYRVGDVFTILAISPRAKMRTFEGRCSITLEDFSSNESYLFLGEPSVLSVKYFDIEGNEITGPMPSITLYQ